MLSGRDANVRSYRGKGLLCIENRKVDKVSGAGCRGSMGAGGEMVRWVIKASRAISRTGF